MKRVLTVLILAVAAVSAKVLAQDEGEGTWIGTYFYSDSELTWQESRLFCERKNLTLASVETKAKGNELQALAPGYENYWTAGTEYGQEGRGAFIWVNNMQPISRDFELWNANEPNDFQVTIRAVSVIFNIEAREILDEPFLRKHFFICE